MIRSYESMARLLKNKREKLGMSQSEVAEKVGVTSGQFISNIERALCSVPIRKIYDVCKTLDIPKEQIKYAYIEDMSRTIDIFWDLETLKGRDGQECNDKD